MKLEFTKNDALFDGIRWVAKALNTNRYDLRKFVNLIYKTSDRFVATDGARLHAYKPIRSLKDEGFLNVRKGFYEIGVNNASKITLFSVPKTDCPDVNNIIKSKAPEGNSLVVEFTYNARYSAAYTYIIRSIDMDFHEMYETLRYTIPCRKCAGAGGSGVPGGDPCPVCIGSGIEGVSASEKLVEDQVLDSYRFLWVNGVELNEMEV